ncbi:MAG TPA: WXG100 family type VII secretion target [Ornithinibacter sp.]|nr:WXG100 family type VII secretion target [Ornithinibacter sp.]
MGDSYRAGEGVVQKSAEIVSTTRGELRQQVNTLRGQMEQVKAHWEGEGARSFDQVSEAWKIQTQDIVDVLDTFEANLTGAQRQYDADDSSAASSLSKYTSMLGK